MERGASLDRITLALAKLKTELVSAEINAKNSLSKIKSILLISINSCQEIENVKSLRGFNHFHITKFLYNYYHSNHSSKPLTRWI